MVKATEAHRGCAAILSLVVLSSTSLCPAQNCSPEEVQKLLASDGAAVDRFGIAVAIDGDVAVSGAYLHVASGTSSGAAYVFRRQTDGSWTQEWKLLPTPAHNGQWFGVAVGVEGDQAIVGAQLDNQGGNSSGAAFVYVREPNGIWMQEAKLVADDASPSQWSGHRVGISGDLAVVSAQLDTDNGFNSGAAYVFRRIGFGQWVQEAKLYASDAAVNAEFGTDVFIHGETIAVGARRANVVGTNSGSAYIFERQTDGSWIEVANLSPADAAAGDEFGFAVAVHGDVAVVGARLTNDAGVNSGSAYVFRRDGASWVEEAKLIGSDTAADDRLGESVAISGNLIVVGARQHDAAGSNAGAAYVFQYKNGSWSETAKLMAGDLTGGEFFGIYVGVSGDRSIIGANLDATLGNQAGAAYIFDLNCESIVGDLNGDGSVGVADLLILLAAWGKCPKTGECPADLNGDGSVGVGDLLILLANWG